VIIAITIGYFVNFARIMRGEILWLREEEYVKAAKTIGVSDFRIMKDEILPNAIAPLIVEITVLFPLAILWEASLSFLGLGVKPTTPTWGLLIASGRGFITTEWWITIMPGIAILVTALAFNVLGDALRDSFDVNEQVGEQ
jgi:peptide/nickel transport system permease protein